MSLRKTSGCITVFLFFSFTQLSAQKLFTYGRQAVSREEFLSAYNKNNPDGKASEASYTNYIDLYYRFKIKVKAALDAGMDTLANQRAEIQSFRNQLSETYLKDDASIAFLVDEAFERSLRDIHVSHIFIPLQKHASEEEINNAQDGINRAYERLKKGESFETVALSNNNLGEANNTGDLGFISVFTLPYELENIVYALAPGKFSPPFRGQAGFHILRNIEERKGAGKLRVAQILFAFQPDMQEKDRQNLQQRADSIYTLAIQPGADFSKLAAAYSEDNLTYNIGGELPAFEPGHYDPAFENAAFVLQNDGDISKPVKTSFGYHIIRRLQRIPVSEDRNNKEWRAVLKERIQQSDRMQAAGQMMTKKIHELVGFKKIPVNEKEFDSITDSILADQPLPVSGLKADSPLFIIGKDTKTVNDFHNYLQEIRGTDEVAALRSNGKLLDKYVETASLDYYRIHLEAYNKEFADQLNEFREGNLLFEIMQKKVWDAAGSDSLGLLKFYNDHHDKYRWELSADALIITSPNKQVAEDAQSELRKNRYIWKILADSSNGIIQADSGRFELSQIPVAERTNFTEGLITAAVTNPQDSTVTFAYIIRMHKETEPKKFEDARGSVINDYQNYLEEQWIIELKKKYPFRLNKKTFRKLPGK